MISEYKNEYPILTVVKDGWPLTRRCSEDSRLTASQLDMVEQDRNVFTSLYGATAGNQWGETTNWLSDAPLSDWYGVYTGASGRVTELDLSCNQLKGTIPSELGELSFLEKLDLSSNDLEGKIPPKLGELHFQESLHIDENDLDGEIPGVIYDIRNLGLRADLVRDAELPRCLIILSWMKKNDFEDSSPIVESFGRLPKPPFRRFRERSEEAIRSLENDECRVVMLRFGLCDGRSRTLEEVGRECRKSREWARVLEARALSKLSRSENPA